MDSASYLKRHEGGIGKTFGIEFTSAEPDHVVAEMRLAAEHFTRAGVVHGGVIMALGDCTGAYGAVLNLPPSKTTATIESKTNFIRRGKGDLLRAAAVPVHIGQTLSVWRTSIFRGGDCIAEVTQTQIVLDQAKPEERPAAAPAPRTSREPVVERILAATSRGFRTAVVDERQRQIFEGACRVIAEKGFAKATIREIAAAAEMPIPTMYQYLDRKEDLLHKIYEYFMSDLVQRLQDWRQSTAPSNEKIAALVRTLLEEFDKNHKYIKIMFQETSSLTPESRNLVYNLDSKYIRIVKDVLDETVENGTVDLSINTELMANYIYFLCVIWPLRHWTIGKFGQDAIAASITEFVLRGLGMNELVPLGEES